MLWTLVHVVPCKHPGATTSRTLHIMTCFVKPFLNNKLFQPAIKWQLQNSEFKSRMGDLLARYVGLLARLNHQPLSSVGCVYVYGRITAARG